IPLWVLWRGSNLAAPTCWLETRPRHATPTWSFLSSGKTRTLTSPSLNKPSWSMRSCSKADRCRLARRDADRLYQTVPGRRRPHRMLSADDCPEVILWEVCRPDLVTPVTRRLRKPLGRIVAKPPTESRRHAVGHKKGLGVIRPTAGRCRNTGAWRRVLCATRRGIIMRLSMATRSGLRTWIARGETALRASTQKPGGGTR